MSAHNTERGRYLPRICLNADLAPTLELALFERVVAPGDPAEEADESFQRLQRSAADAEQSLRARLLHPLP